MPISLSVSGLMNLRDVGGLSTRDGGRIREGALLRSASPYFLDADGARELVERIGVRLRIDLRSALELEEATNPLLEDGRLRSAHLPFRSGGRWSAERTDPALPQEDRVSGHYLRYLEHASDSVLGVVRHLADPDQHAVLIHCTAGKDRTGVAVAVVLEALGVPDEQIVEDYAATRHQLAGLLDQIRLIPSYAERLRALPAEALGAEPASLARFLVRMREAHGSATDYLRNHGLGPSELTSLRAALVVDG